MNRREFLFGSAAVAGLAKTGVFAKDIAAKKKRPLFGICRSSVKDVTIMRDLGYDFWEAGVSEILAPDKDDAWWLTSRENIAKRPLPILACNGFIPRKFRLTGPKADHGPALDYAEKAIRRASEIGIKSIVLGSGGARNVHGDFGTNNWPNTEKGTKDLVSFCKKLAERVEDVKNVCVVLEPLRPNESNILNYVFQGVNICREVNSERIMMLADIFHMLMGGDDPESILKAGNLLKHVHIAEYGTRSFPGSDPKQNEKYEVFFNMLRKIGYSGGISVESGWEKNLDFSKKAKVAIETMKGLI